MATQVKVVVRIRPLADDENSGGDDNKPFLCVTGENTITITPPEPRRLLSESLGQSLNGASSVGDHARKMRPTTFTFDRIFVGESVDKPGRSQLSKAKRREDEQEVVFSHVSNDLLQAAWEGFNVSMFAYGQTGSGKTYTMIGSPKHRGVIPRFCDALLERISTASKEPSPSGCTVEYSLEATLLEVYNEAIADLFLFAASGPATAPGRIRIREHPTMGPYCPELTRVTVTSSAQIQGLLRRGFAARTTASTSLNAESSRSHAVFTLTFSRIETDPESGATVATVSQVNFVDLAGSERLQSMEKRDETLLKETGEINKSLLYLSRVITLLGEAGASASASSSVAHIPYRDSTLTWLLRESLGGNAKTVILASITPAAAAAEETLNTLRYAAKATRIVNTAVVNLDPTARVIAALRAKIAALRSELDDVRSSHQRAGAAADAAPAVAVYPGREATLNDSTTIMDDSRDDGADQGAELSVLVEALHRGYGAAEVATASVEAQTDPVPEPAALALARNRPYLLNLTAAPRLGASAVLFLDRGETLLGTAPHAVALTLVNGVVSVRGLSRYCHCVIGGVRLERDASAKLRTGELMALGGPSGEVWWLKPTPVSELSDAAEETAAGFSAVVASFAAGEPVALGEEAGASTAGAVVEAAALSVVAAAAAPVGSPRLSLSPARAAGLREARLQAQLDDALAVAEEMGRELSDAKAEVRALQAAASRAAEDVVSSAAGRSAAEQEWLSERATLLAQMEALQGALAESESALRAAESAATDADRVAAQAHSNAASAMAAAMELRTEKQELEARHEEGLAALAAEREASLAAQRESERSTAARAADELATAMARAVAAEAMVSRQEAQLRAVETQLEAQAAQVSELEALASAATPAAPAAMVAPVTPKRTTSTACAEMPTPLRSLQAVADRLKAKVAAQELTIATLRSEAQIAAEALVDERAMQARCRSEADSARARLVQCEIARQAAVAAAETVRGRDAEVVARERARAAESQAELEGCVVALEAKVEALRAEQAAAVAAAEARAATKLAAAEAEVHESRREALRWRVLVGRPAVDVHFGGGVVKAIHVGDDRVAAVAAMLEDANGGPGALFEAKVHLDERSERLVGLEESPLALQSNWGDQRSMYSFHFKAKGRLRVHFTATSYKTLVVSPQATAREILVDVCSKLDGVLPSRHRLAYEHAGMARVLGDGEYPLAVLSRVAIDLHMHTTLRLVAVADASIAAL